MGDVVYDLVVAGGGIAGLATAEIFARSGFKVALLEKNEFLCNETSGLHHEWFHMGNLYSIFPSNQYLRTMVGGIDDILLYYRDFEGMNLMVNGDGKLITVDKCNRWVKDDYLEYVINTRNDPDFNMNKFEGISNYLQKLFFKFTWDMNVKQFISRHNRFFKYDWRKGCASHYIPRAGWLDYTREHIDKFSRVDVNLDTDTHIKIDSYDRTMNALNIIKDITRSFLSNNGRIFTNTELIEVEEKGSLVELTTTNKDILRANKVILALGKGLDRFSKGKFRVKTVASPLLVAYPNVCDINVVRLTPFYTKTINHLCHTVNGHKYSLIGGGYSADPNNLANMQEAESALMARAQAVFPKLKNAKLKKVYFGYKTEVSSSLAERNYLYHIDKIGKNIWYLVPGKFCLGFSVAVNAFKKLNQHDPSTYTNYDYNTDISKYISEIKHKNIVADYIINNVH